MKKQNTKKIIKKVLNKTAELREEVLEAAALEKSKIVEKDILKIIWIAWQTACSMLDIQYANDIDAEDIMYQEDDKTLTQRLNDIYKIYSTNHDLGFLWNKLEVIMNTEVAHGVNLPAAAALNKYPELYTGIFRAEISEGECAICKGFNGEVFDIDEIDFPPFHPNCMCSIDIIEEDIDVGEVIVEIDKSDLR